MHKIIRDLDHQAKNIHWLEFELSNNCQYANEHKWCPRYFDKRPITFLQSRIVHKVVEFFKPYNFHGRVFLSGYSEPLLDPRLIDLVKYIKANLPHCHILMFTNGIACDENLLTDLHQAGVERIMLSIYSTKELKRLEPIAQRSPATIMRHRVIGSADDDIDNRINVYNEGTKGVGGPCYMPTLYYFVRNNGDVNMCFWDWKYTQIFGNLYHNSVEETLMNEERLMINRELVNSNRSVLPVCNACQLPDYRCTREYCKEMIL
jgi:MoaA/NifB/PqqE/SkfB family radical SAM enzyme